MALLQSNIECDRDVSSQNSSTGYWAGVVGKLRKDVISIVAFLVILTIVLLAIFAPYVAPADPYLGSITQRLKGVGTNGFLLGSDELGRDMLSRLIYGARYSLIMGVVPVILAFFLGSTIGVVAGYAGGVLNTVIMRTVDILYAFPSILLAVALSGTLGAGVYNAIFALTAVFTPQIIRIAEAVTTQVRTQDYVEAARISGAGPVSIIRVHVLNNVLGPIFVYATSLVSVSMILASGLSFLGLGVRPPEAEWGLMLNTLRTAVYSQPLIAAMPGIAIFITSLAFNTLADGLRNAMEVR